MSTVRTARPDFLAITGSTASGKTAVSLLVAEEIGGEVISMDSRQVYRGMDVGTAKVTLKERGRVPHHGLDLLDPDERYSAGQFARDARRWIGEIRSRNHTPVLVGGTGFFLRALTHPMFEEPPMNPRRRQQLAEVLSRMPPEQLESWVRSLDPERADVAIRGGRQRMIRTCSVALLSGRPLSWWHGQGEPEQKGLEGTIVVLTLPREELNRRIDERVSIMVEEGFVSEVQALVEAGFGRESPGMSGTGYREFLDHIEGRASLEEAIERIRVSTRQYARRQLTWFRGQLPAHAIRIDATRSAREIAREVIDAWGGREGAGAGGRTTAGNRDHGSKVAVP